MRKSKPIDYENAYVSESGSRWIIASNPAHYSGQPEVLELHADASVTLWEYGGRTSPSECDAFLPSEPHKPMCKLLETLKLAGAALDLWLNGPGDAEGLVTDRALTAVNAAIKRAAWSMSPRKRKYPAADAHGSPRTPWAIVCRDSGRGWSHGLVYLTHEEYNRQMNAPESLWKCPICRCSAAWDDENFKEQSS